MTFSRSVLDEILSLSQKTSILQKISVAMPFLNEAERSIAEFMLDSPLEVCTYTAAQIAKKTKTSEATVFRLCKTIGYSGLTAVKVDLARAASIVDNFSISNHNLDTWTSTVQTSLMSILNTYSILDFDSLKECAKEIVQARTVNICGMGPISGRLAEILAFSLQTLGLQAHSWVDIRANLLPESYLEFGNVVIGISYSGMNTEVGSFLSTARKCGAIAISITNYPFSLVAKNSDYVLCTGIREETVQKMEMVPRISQLIILQSLVDLVKELQARDAVRSKES